MKNFKYFNKNTLGQILALRDNETKLGEKICYSNGLDFEKFLQETEAKFIVYGIKEFVGIKANNGRIGSLHNWEIFLNSFLNIQNNKYLKGQNIAVVGCFDFDESITDLDAIDDVNELYDIVNEIDKEITFINSLIHKYNKYPIVIGGGHNNAYGNLKGLALAKGQKINVVNFDAHTDFRALEGRHSGNGFSYAFDEGFLGQYVIFGAHENYLNKHMLQQFKANVDSIKMFTYDDMMVTGISDFDTNITQALKLVKGTYYGVEIDLDAIENVSSSAMSPSGFSVLDARKFTYKLAQSDKASYLHICEGSASLGVMPQAQLGKLITYLVTDFMKSKLALEKE